MEKKYKPVPEDRMPGEDNPDIGRLITEYLSHFSFYRIKKDWAIREDLYSWCAAHLGEQYKDWFVFEGGKYDKWWTVNIRSPKKGTFFALRWNDIILESVDRRDQK
jgi:hypothetical protein